MTKTETVVRLLKAAIDGSAKVELERDFSKKRHCFVNVKIDGSVIKIWMRNNLRRVESVVFADGSATNEDTFFEEKWLPPRNQFEAWWTLMDGFENATAEQLSAQLDEAVRQFERTRIIEPGIDPTAGALRRMNAVTAARDRLDGFDPLRYLSEAELDALERALTVISAGKK